MWQNNEDIQGEKSLLICIALYPVLSPLFHLLGPCQVLLVLTVLLVAVASRILSAHPFRDGMKEFIWTMQGRGKAFTVGLHTTMGVVEIQLMFPGRVIPNHLPLLPSQQ